MAKPKTQKRRDAKARETVPAYQAPSGSTHAFRETIESIAIAFVLAFLFRTFEAEAFVIPTGSMSPSLQGQHKDVDCSECGHRFRVSASEEASDDPRVSRGELYARQIVGGVCPMCRQVMPMRSDVKTGPAGRQLTPDDNHPTYPGDRILVNKYGYFYGEPERWDVVVFKFPGNGEMNYIKRLVGLSGEELQVYQGDIFTRPLDSKERFEIERKPADKVVAMLQPVHDSDYESNVLYKAGWPLRWAPEGESAWQVSASSGDLTIEQEFSVEAPAEGETQWLRYRHYIPTEYDWEIARQSQGDDQNTGSDNQAWANAIRPQLILDFNPYNASLQRAELQNNFGDWEVPQVKRGLNWVSDLAVVSDVSVESQQGEFVVDLVEGGKHFTCAIDLATGQATLSIDGLDGFQPQAQTPVQGSGNYEIKFANVDDQLLLWVDGTLIEFEDATYDADRVFGERERIMPRTSDEDAGDLAPVGVGARGAKLSIERLQVLRDIYYIAVNHRDSGINRSDYDAINLNTRTPDDEKVPALRNERQLFVDPEAWPRFLTRHKRPFVVDEDQFFVMGDNSPASLDCRLWTVPQRGQANHPGGPYLDRRLMTGKAVCVFWPHSWGHFPFIEKLPGFPNFGDMRIVR